MGSPPPGLNLGLFTVRPGGPAGLIYTDRENTLNETVDTAIVPKKREIPVGTLRSILNQAHIDPNQWDKLALRREKR